LPISGTQVYSGGTAVEDAFNNVINSTKFDEKDRARYTTMMNQYIESGDMAKAKDLILSLVYQGSNVQTQNQLHGTETALRHLNDVEKNLDAFVAAGGNTNILRGTIEKIERKLGTTTDPRLVNIATLLQNSLIEYRRSMTGVQFSFAEAQQYAEMWGKITNTVAVNKELISTMKSALQTNSEVTISSVIGNDNYKQLFGGGGGEVVIEYNGKQYKVGANGELTEI
jgi:hypothetical protein